MSPVATNHHGHLYPASLLMIAMAQKTMPLVVFRVVCVATLLALPQNCSKGG